MNRRRAPFLSHICLYCIADKEREKEYFVTLETLHSRALNNSKVEQVRQFHKMVSRKYQVARVCRIICQDMAFIKALQLLSDPVLLYRVIYMCL